MTMTNRQKAIARSRFAINEEGQLVARVGYKKGRVRVRTGDPVGWGATASYVSLAGSKVKVSDVIDFLREPEIQD